MESRNAFNSKANFYWLKSSSVLSKKDSLATHSSAPAILMIFDDFLRVSTFICFLQTFGILVPQNDWSSFFVNPFEQMWNSKQVCNSVFMVCSLLLSSHDLLSFFYKVLHISSGIIHLYFIQLYFSLSLLYTNGKNGSCQIEAQEESRQQP